MKKCGYGCSYWDSNADSCNCNPKPVTERTKESVGCKFHNGPDAPILGQMEFDAPIHLMPLCQDCQHNPATSRTACGFEHVLDAETGEIVGVKCTGLAHTEDPAEDHGSLCSRCANDPTNGAPEPCEREIDDIDGTCLRFVIADGAWPCCDCAEDYTICGYTTAGDGLCPDFDKADDDINQLCKSCAAWGGNYELPEPQDGIMVVPFIEHCSGKTDGSVECEDYVEMPAPASDSATADDVEKEEEPTERTQGQEWAEIEA